MQSGHATTAIAPVLCAGVGARYASGWAIRLASIRLDPSDLGGAALGIVTPRSASSAALVDLLSGRLAPAYGNLAVLGHDMRTAAGRAAAAAEVGIASRASRTVPGVRIRGIVERAARLAGQPGSDRHLLVAAILDRLALTPWAEVPARAAPDLIARKVRLAAACVHQPQLLVIDGLLDQLSALDLTVLADVIRDLKRDTAVIALGRRADSLALVCDHVIALADGIVIGPVRQPIQSRQVMPSDLAAPDRPSDVTAQR